MRTKLVALLLLGLALMGLIALLREPEGSNIQKGTPAESQSISALKPARDPNISICDSSDISQHGRSIRISRHVKIPDDLGYTGTALLTTENEFLRLVGNKNRRYLRWNNVNFSKESVLVFAKQYGTSAPGISIHAIEKVGSMLIVHVAESWGGNGSRPAVVCIGWEAVVIQKSEPASDICVKIVNVAEGNPSPLGASQ